MQRIWGGLLFIGMPNRLSLLVTGLALAALHQTAEASPDWHLSQQLGNVNGYCNGNGISTQVGYYGETTPRTGDNPNSALVVTVTAGCGPVTVAPGFQFPAGTVQDTSQAVECYRKKNGVIIAPAPVCSTTAIWPNDWNVVNMFGWTNLAAGETLEIYVPIGYVKAATNTQAGAIVYNNFGPLNPTVTFNIAHQPRFANFSVVNSSDSQRADISFKLDHFHEASQVFVDYGTSTSFGSTIGGGTTNPLWTYYQTFAMPTIYGLASNTLYYYRVRLVTPYGTFTSDTQSFRTYAQLEPLPDPNRPVYECRRLYCGFGR